MTIDLSKKIFFFRVIMVYNEIMKIDTKLFDLILYRAPHLVIKSLITTPTTTDHLTTF